MLRNTLSPGNVITIVTVVLSIAAIALFLFLPSDSLDIGIVYGGF
ncbi:MAG TPA: hypothetical protein VFQ79_21485 [Bryobacteraceae bacterium]|nr:hypothetical protein [Bryobacteraceae bacterium]